MSKILVHFCMPEIAMQSPSAGRRTTEVCVSLRRLRPFHLPSQLSTPETSRTPQPKCQEAELHATDWGHARPLPKANASLDRVQPKCFRGSMLRLFMNEIFGGRRTGGRSGLCTLFAIYSLAACTGVGGAVGATPGKRRLPQISGWKPTVVLKITRRNTFPPPGLPGPGPRLRTGVAWTQGAYAVASPTRSFGLVAWQRPLSPQSQIATIPYRSGGFNGTASPAGLIARKRSIGVGYFWKGRHGGNPRLDVDWYSRKGLKFLRFYRIVLRGVRNAGIQLVAPPGGSWFATIPTVAAKGDQARIRVWNTQNGKPLPVHFPLLRQRHNSAFCNSGALGWVDGSEQVYLARLGSQPGGRAVVRQMVLGREPLRCGAMSPDGKRLLLISRTNRYFPGRVTIIMAPTSGTGEMEVLRYLRTGGSIAAPVFSPDSHFAAFALIAVKGPIFRGIDLILVRVRGLRVVHWAHIPMVLLPRALSFSPDGRQVALVADHQIFIFNISGNQRGLSRPDMPLSDMRRVRLPKQSGELPARRRSTESAGRPLR